MTRRPISVFIQLLFLLLAVALLGTFSSGPRHTANAATGVTWERFDADIDVLAEGTLRIAERQEILFTGRSFSVGFATIPLERVDDITNIRVSEERDGQTITYDFVSWNSFVEESETFSYRKTSSEVEINWAFPLTMNDSRVFLLEYDAAGAIRVYQDEAGQTYNQIWWGAITSDVTEIGDVLDSVVTIRLPEAVDPSQALLGEDGDEPPEEHTTDGQNWTWTRQGLQSGDEFIVRLEVPAVTSAVAPSWQAEDDARRLEEEQSEDRQALYNVIFLGIGLMSVVVGGAALYGLWYTRGRDPHVGLVAEFLPDPPDDLPPGAAGALVDEVAHERDVVATIVDLGHKGVIRIDQQGEDRELPVYQSPDFTLKLLEPDTKITRFERGVLDAIFGLTPEAGQTVLLSQAKSRFSSQSGAVKELMYDELVKRGYFLSSPEVTRGRWKTGSTVMIVAAVLLICAGGGVLADLSPFVFLPLIVLAAIGIVLRQLSRALPQKTRAGAEAAAKWLAFRKYLADVEKYDKIKDAQERFDMYLPYAVAFGLEEGWVTKFAAAGGQPPAWYGPVVVADMGDWARPRRHRGSTWGGGTWVFPGQGGWDSGDGGRDSGGGGFDFPDLQDMSDSAGRGLQGTSNSLFDMLASAAEAFGDISSSGGGRRHWGGGGGGFRGGGSRGGFSGGGGRGFR